ncbi:MAG: YggT family protein [Actinomycetota bacterium]
MTLFWSLLAFLLYLYLLMVLTRIVIDVTRQFARSWRPVGVTAVGLEVVYASTDPPVRLLRRLIPPLRLGGISLDLSIMILWIAILVLRSLALSFA